MVELNSTWVWVGPKNFWSDTLNQCFEKGDIFHIHSQYTTARGESMLRLRRDEWPADKCVTWKDLNGNATPYGHYLAIECYEADFAQYMVPCRTEREQVLGSCRCSAHMLLWGGHERSCPYTRGLIRNNIDTHTLGGEHGCCDLRVYSYRGRSCCCGSAV